VREYEGRKEIDIEHYVRVMKEHEARRASFNERQEYWTKYNNKKKTDPETGFDMNDF
jgi:hypothetical protein